MNILLVIEGAGTPLRGVRLSGSEGISELFRFEIEVIRDFPMEGVASAFLDKLGLDSLRAIATTAARQVYDNISHHVGLSATLTLDTGENSRTVNGIITEFAQLDDGKTGTAYKAVLVPDVARLLHRKDSRIFQESSAPDIIARVLDAAGIRDEQFRFALVQERPKREYCVQYRESDWAFVTRLLEEEGIHFFFEGNVLVMADAPTAHEPIEDGSLIFRAPLGAMAHGEHASRFAWTERLTSTKTTLRDYDFKKPALSLEVSHKADDGADVYDFPGRYEAPARGSELAAMRLEELHSRRRTGAGTSDSCRIIPGQTFLLVEHPDDAMNVSYLVMHVEHRGSAPISEGTLESESSYENQFEVVHAETKIRPLRSTPRPIIAGPQTAVVVGPGKEELHTDVYGRVKVQFHWDRQGKKDDYSSCWMRVMQPSAGAGWGAMFLPRVGHEVVVTFLEGDPDRPLVIGSVYNGANVQPYSLPHNKTRSTIRTKSFGGDGHNEIRFDDAPQGEELYVHAERDYNDVVKRNRSSVIHGERRQTIDKNDAEHVGGDQKIAIDGNQHVHIRGNQRTIVDGNDSSDKKNFCGSGTTVRGKYEVDASDTMRMQAPNSILLECGGSSLLIEPGKITMTAGDGAKIVLDPNALMQSVAGSRVFADANVHAQASAGAEVLLDANARATSSAGSNLLLDANACLSSTGGSSVLLDGNALVSSPAQAIMAAPSASVMGEASAVMAGPGGAVAVDGGVNIGGGSIAISGGAVNVAGGVVAVN